MLEHRGKKAKMHNGISRCENLVEVLNQQIALLAQPCEVMSIFAGGVYWETLAEFQQNKEADHDMARLLELRAYSENGEFHAQRSCIDATCPFIWHTIVDTPNDGERAFFDDVQRIDRDDKRIAADSANRLFTTGGGSYTLPDASAERIRLRNYIEFNENGMAEIVDFRIVGLEGGAL